jgi:uncharacterized protein YbbC (DUF1343 family)
MIMIVIMIGLNVFHADAGLLKKYSGRVGYLCHSASIDALGRQGIFLMMEIFGERLKALFSPQHGLATDVQDNMLESPHFFHSHYQLPVYSLYSETRAPTDAMLDGLDHLFIDLQDVGARTYTYIYTMLQTMVACAKKGIDVVVLDRPNPIGGEVVEGNVLDPAFTSFVGLLPLPMRHGMTIGEIARLWEGDCRLEVVPMQGWRRSMYFEDTGLPWVLPSPNFPSIDTGLVFPGTVIFEATNISEGRGTVKPFEIFGHPKLDALGMLSRLEAVFGENGLGGFFLRPVTFMPVFDKYQDQPCNGYQIHVTDRGRFRPWRVGQILCREFYHHLGDNFSWRQPPFEYEYEKMPIDILNGTDKLRKWVEKNGPAEELEYYEMESMASFMERREKALLYPSD